MTPSLAANYDALAQRAGLLSAEVERIRRAFVAASGAFLPEDAFYEERAAALFDRVLTDPVVLAALDDEKGPWIAALGRAQRGLYEVRVDAEGVDLACVITGAEFRLSPLDAMHGSLRLGRSVSTGELLDAFVVSTPEGVSLLPGVLSHAASARVALDAIVAATVGATVAGRVVARESRDALLDLLLGMRHRLATLGRMRPEVVYRLSARGPS